MNCTKHASFKAAVFMSKARKSTVHVSMIKCLAGGVITHSDFACLIKDKKSVCL